ncbi:MAG: YgiQ family radical SAM protein, partial [Planctomycetaceae bacterium]|nr:YgiQ family radical SAM protein [Planctomycetaceae bacterium]
YRCPPEEVQQRNWDSVDIVFVTGDAYVDHPSFANGLLARLLEAEGYKVAVLAQPDWHSAQPWRQFGKPNLAFCISAGNMDSMVNHYTANRKMRNEDAYSPNGKIGLRPDRATLAYCQRAREAFPGECAIIAGGIEASLRRFAHYDYWSDKIKRSILLDSKADLLVYGMGEEPLLEILRRMKDGEQIHTIKDVRGTVYRIKRNEDLPAETETCIHLPSMEEAEEDKSQFAKMTKMIYDNQNPYLGITLVQEHALEAVVVNPPPLPSNDFDDIELDRIYGLPFTRKAHPSYGTAKIPALETVKTSIQTHRGCFGGCTFCALTAHQGKFIQSRSSASIIDEVKTLCDASDKAITISDLGGPTANMYANDCGDAKRDCRRLSCLAPSVCPNLAADHQNLIKLLRSIKRMPKVDNVFVASGIRTDLALLDERYIKEIALHHTGGHLKTAPEHTDEKVLRLMNKPPIENYDVFCERFMEFSRKSGKEQYLVPYFMAGFPGTDLKSMIETAVYLKRHGLRPEQVQEFIPVPLTIATAMYYTGLNPMDGQPVYVPKRLRERRQQKALLMYYDSANYFDVKSALLEAGRGDLIGDGPDCLIKKVVTKSEAFRRSSRVKRLQKQNEKEKSEKQQRREHFEQLMQEEEQKKKERQAERRKPPEKAEGRKPFDRKTQNDRTENDRAERRKPFDKKKPFKSGMHTVSGKKPFRRGGRKPFGKKPRDND